MIRFSNPFSTRPSSLLFLWTFVFARTDNNPLLSLLSTNHNLFHLSPGLWSNLYTNSLGSTRNIQYYTLCLNKVKLSFSNLSRLVFSLTEVIHLLRSSRYNLRPYKMSLGLLFTIISLYLPKNFYIKLPSGVFLQTSEPKGGFNITGIRRFIPLFSPSPKDKDHWPIYCPLILSLVTF